MPKTQYEYIKSNPALYEANLQRTREWRAREKIKKEKTRAVEIKDRFLTLIPLWDDLKDFLEPIEVQVLTLIYCLDDPDKHRTFQDVADIVGMSKQGVQYHRNRALKRIEAAMTAKNV
jgi:DNA-directed RNA polymerase sigma subunit (sigma70/sigma32)